MNIISARNGVYTENGNINSEVHFEGFDDFIPFTASPEDSEEHGRHLYADLKAGKYGPVAPFTVTPEMLTVARLEKHDEINVWRNQQEHVSITFSLNGHRWDCDKTSQDRLSASLEADRLNILPADFFWTDADNIDVPVKSTDLEAMSTAMRTTMFLQGFRIHERQRQMKEEVEALTTLADIRNYRVGWL